MSSMLDNLTNPLQKDQLEERMSKIKDGPSLKPILDEIESGGPTAMMRIQLLGFCWLVWVMLTFEERQTILFFI